jgi:L-aminopeptidase/D-esterase-like protein
MGAVEAVEESVLNAMLAADPMIGKRGRRVAALDPARLKSFF